MAKKRKHEKTFFYISILTILILSTLTLSAIEHFSTDEYTKINNIRIINNTVILFNNCTALIAETSPERAHSIELGLENKIEVRPNTHDIFAEVLKKFNITLENVTLDNFSNNIYYAKLYLKQGNNVLKIDLKPSDGIALALRTESPVYIKTWILEKMGQNICK
ncbi:MAG: bifunctional nuclease family protein [Candidatus Aenigmarchaeota archaeon]|nr:bifunctional nuclease family protein [Candidatus Aenigmarchaeota archaeon]